MAFQYVPTAISKSLAEHDAVLIAQVTSSEMGTSTVEARSTIKGMTPKSIELPDTWRRGTENTYGPVRLEKEKTFLLMLRRGEQGQYLLSKDFAAFGVVPVKSTADPLVRATIILFELSRSDTARAREHILSEAWKNESDETKVNLLKDFFYCTAPDDAIIPFLTEAMRVETRDSKLPVWSALVIQKHKLKKSIPDLLKVLNDKQPACRYAAMTLGRLEVKEAYEPIMAMINDKHIGDRLYFIHAICYLKDERSIPLLTETLESYHANNRRFDESWAKPLTQVLDIPDKRLRILAVEALGKVGPIAFDSLYKIKQLRESLKDDSEFQSVARVAMRMIDLRLFRSLEYD